MLLERRGEDHHRRMRQLEDVPRELEPVHLRHVDVGQHEVGDDRVQQLERLAAVRGFADDGERERLGAVLEQLVQPSPGRGLVVDDHHPQSFFAHWCTLGAARRPSEREQFAPWGGPAALIRGLRRCRAHAPRQPRRRRAGAPGRRFGHRPVRKPNVDFVRSSR